MPARNTLRFYDIPAYYHVYNRGANKQPIFLDDMDHQKFLSLLERYLDTTTPHRDQIGREYPHYPASLVAYCLMENHFHLLLYQDEDVDAISNLMKSVSTAYTMYFNLRYKHQGTLFQGVFKASRIADEAYLLHISRYIHMNPRHYLRYSWSSIHHYLGTESSTWIRPGLVNTMQPREYREFLRSYEGKRAELALLKDELADS